MQIHEIIMQDGVYKRYADKYTKPLYHYRDNIPKNIIKKFYKQADIEEVALYYFGLLDFGHKRSFPAFLSHLERLEGFKVPVVSGILTHRFWDRWCQDNLLAIMDQAKIFGIG
jgi:hypothetical protein